jgi:cytochrome c556
MEETMSRVIVLAAAVGLLASTTVYAQDNKDWCTSAHMKQMDQKIGQMTDATKKKEATMHLDQSKAAMGKGDTAGCIEHMKQAHTAMGM